MHAEAGEDQGKHRGDVLLTHRFFAPSPQPYGWMLLKLARALAGDGWTVSIYCGAEANRQAETEALDQALAADGIKVIRKQMMIETRGRTWARIWNATMYIAGLIAAIVRTRPKYVTVATFPPVVPAFAASLSCRLLGRAFVYHVQDIHPEITAPKLKRPLRAPYSLILGLLEKHSLSSASRIVTLSTDMAGVLEGKGAHPDRLKILNNFSLSANEQASYDSAGKVRSKKMRLVFAGNLGAYQDIPALGRFVRRIVDGGYAEVRFVGEGVSKKKLKEHLADYEGRGVSFFAAVPFAELLPHFRWADMGLVSLDDCSWKYAYPSKIVTYLKHGLPVLCLISPASSIASEVKQGRFGIVVAENELEEGIQEVEKLSLNRSRLNELALNARRHYETHHSSSAISNNWRKLFAELCSDADHRS